MRTLLINPPWSLKEQYGGSLKKVGSISPPLGLAYIAAVLEEHDREVSILDCIALRLNYKQLRKIVRKINPNIVGITALTPMITRSFEAAKAIRQELPDSYIVMGGPHPSIFPKRTLKECSAVDFAVEGEGEFTMLELVETLERDNERKMSEVNGITYRENGRIVKNPPRKPVKDLDELPLPARHLLPMDKYKPSPIVYKRLPSHTMITSRGCPYRCAYCSKPVFGKIYRERSPENVLNEMKFLRENYGARDIVFYDDTFILNPRRINKLCDLILEEGLDITWSCSARADLVNDLKLLKKMRSSGCWQMRFGIESGNQELLDRINKDITLDQVRTAFSLCKKAKIEIRANFMLGLPGETPEMTEKTINFAKELDAEYASFYVTIPFPGTGLFELAKKDGGYFRDTDWESYLMASNEDPIFVTSNLTSEQLKAFYKKAYREFYLRPSFILKHLLKIKSSTDIKRLSSAFLSLIGL